MAFVITNKNTLQDDAFIAASPRTEQNDLSVLAAATTSGASAATVANARTFRAYVWLKTTAGSSTIEIKLQVSDVTGFTGTNTLTVDQKTILVNTATGANFGGYYFELKGAHPLIAGAAGFMRVQFVTGTGTSATVDLMLESA